MALVTVPVGGTTTISTSQTDSAVFVGAGTLNIAGTAQNPITVVLSSVGGAGLLDTINMTYADVSVGGTAGVSALVAYNLGAGSTMRLQSTIGIAAGSSITFTAPKSHLVINPGVGLNQLSNISVAGFGPGSNIDVQSTSFASYTYADAAGSNTGGTLTLLDANGNSLGTIGFTTGDFTAASFNVHEDGTGGTLVDFATYVSGLSATPSTADLPAGSNVVFNLATTGPVTIAGGTPTLTLNDGGVATYDALHSTATNLVFNYTVAAGQNTPDLTVTAVNLNGATATDALGSAVSLAGGVGNPAGILQIDTTPPTITGISATPGSGSVAAGQVVAINLTTSEPVTIAGGVPTLTLNDGGTATYDAVHSTATNLVFNYTVQSGQNTPNLSVTAANLNGATMTDGAGNAGSLAGGVGSPVGTLQIDTTPPSIASISTTPGSGSLAAGQIVSINLTPTEAVTIAGGTPTLSLNDGGTATYDPNSSTATNLVFKYTVQAGQNTPDLTITAANLNGATIRDAAGNAGTLVGGTGNPAGILQIDTTAPTITSISTSPNSGSLAAGRVVTINLTPSEAVTVAGGTPTLTLNDGGTATYDAAHSSATNLAFTYTVQPGQNTANLTISGISLNNATITDPAGNAANLAGAVGAPSGTLQIDTTPPTVASLSTTPGSGSLSAGQVVAINLATSENVIVAGGTPTLSLNDGGTAIYDSSSSTAQNLVFRYTVQPGQNTPDLTVSTANLNGATITDPAGNAIDLTGAVGNPPGTLQIDTTPPTIIGLSTTPSTGALAAGQVVAINLTPSEAVNVAAGTPTLSLNSGGTAYYDAVHSTATNLIFNYTVQPGQNATDLTVTGSNLNGATITDPAGNPANLAGAIGNPPGTLQIITSPPAISSVSTTPNSGSLGAGQIVTFNLTPTSLVTVAGGTPTLALNDGGTATYDPNSSTSSNLVFKYTVQAGQNTPDLAITAANLNGATMTDAAGNTGSLAAAVVNPPGTLQIDTTPPTIASISTSPGSGSIAAGQVVAINLTPSEAVMVAGGTPTLSLNDGGTATYDPSSSTATNLVFRYTVLSGQNTSDLTVVASNLNGATITDPAGNAINLAGAVGNPPGTLQIDTTPPTIISLSTTPSNGALAAGQVVAINLTPSEAVMVVGGTPTLTLNSGGTAIYDAVHSTATNLVFNYTVQAGQNATDLTITGSNLNGATIADPAGNPANMAGAIGNPPGTLQIITTPPTVTGISTTPGSGALTVGQIVAINVTPSTAVMITGGTPTLMLNDGGTATYDPNSSTTTNLVFKYTVQAGQNTPDLTITGSNLNGATMTDVAGNAGTLAGAVGNPPGILQIDTTAPTITSVTTTPGSGTLGAGQVVAFNVTTSEPVTVAGGTPTLTLNDGGTASYDPNSSSATTLVFKYVVRPGDNTPDLTVTGSNLNGASITDPAGNAADLTGVIGNPPGVLQIDMNRAAVTSVYGVTTTPGSGDLAAGSNVVLTVTLTGNATIAGGTPTLTLSDGGTASFDRASSTSTSLVFRHTVQAGQNTPDLTVTAVSLNGATALDGAGNPADLSGAVVNPGGILQIDTTPPTITGVSATPGSGSFGAGQVLAITVAISEAVTVSGGTPILTLNDGGIATYDATNSTPTTLAFRYTVQPGQNTDGLAVTGMNLNGAVVADGAGNAANLAAAAGTPTGAVKIDTTAPTVTAVATQPGSGTVTAGQVISFVVTPSEAVAVVGGIPSLTLSDGGTAIFDPTSSTPGSLVFKYTVQPGDTDNDLAVTATSLNGASVTDPAGNPLDLNGAIGNPPGILEVNTVPVVTSVVVDPPNGDLKAGATVTFQVAMSGSVTLTGGAPTLSLSDGGTAAYDAASSTPTMLVFRHTVQPGQNAPDLEVSAVFLNGTVVTDGMGRTVSLSGAVGNPAGVLQIDTIKPTATSIVQSGSLEPGGVFVITINMSEPVIVTGTGTPSFTLANGGIATRSALLSTPTANVFTYTVQPGDDTSNIAIVNFDPAGTTLADLAGNLVDDASIGAAIAAAQGNLTDVTMSAVSPTTIDVYRFFETATGTHFYTQSQTERASILATRPDLVPEGQNGVGLTAVSPTANDPNAMQVYRFFDLIHGTQFLTASLTERDNVISTRRDLVYEPNSGFLEHVTQQVGDTPVYRFFDTTYGTHFYSDSASERATILATRPDLVDEGVGFYEPARNPAK